MVNSMAIEADFVISFKAAFMEVNLIFIQALEFVDFDLKQELSVHPLKVVNQLQDSFDLVLAFKQVVFPDPMLAL